MSTIGSLRSRRNACIVAGDAARGERKALSEEIGLLMRGAGKKGGPGGGGAAGSAAATTGSDKKENETVAVADAVAVIKTAVEAASARAAAADVEQAAVDAEMGALFAMLPNLLDDCVPDGADEESNILMEVATPADTTATHYYCCFYHLRQCHYHCHYHHR